MQRDTQPLKSYASSIAPSTWFPPNTVKKDEELWTEFVSGCHSPPIHSSHSNLSKPHKTAWRELKNNPDTFLLKADKGGKVVMWTRLDYETEALRQLNDASTYRPLTATDVQARLADIRTAVEDSTHELRDSGCITRSEAERLLALPYKVPAIYFQPKIHKEKRGDTGTYAGRPIMAAVSGPLKPLDEFIARTTSPLLKLIPGSLNDTRHLIQQLSDLGSIPEGAILFSADVESLYPSIDWDEGRRSATRFYAEKYFALEQHANENHLLPPPKPRLFSKILHLVLSNNILHFRDRLWFQQLKGTAMGCSISVFLANTFMYYRTRNLLQSPPPNLLYLGRYIDDLIGIWNGPAEDIPAIFSQTVDGDIRLTYEIGGNTLEALDLRIFFHPDRTLGTKLHRKPTDGHQFIHWTSSHPNHVKLGVLYSQLLRIKRNCSEEKDYEEEKKTLVQRFRLRGYPEDKIVAQVQKADKVQRGSLLLNARPAPTATNDRMTFVTSYHRAEAAIALRRNLELLWTDLINCLTIRERAPYVNGPVLPDVPPRLAFRSEGSLGSSLGPVFKRGDRETGESFAIKGTA